MSLRASARVGSLKAEMNIVPYVDVMLVLLVIFMITAPLIHQGVELDLPAADAKALPQKSKPPLIISVDKEGALYLNISDAPSTPIEAAILKLRIAAEHQRDPQRSILIRGDGDANYHHVVAAMTALQQAGIEHIGLMTQPEP